MTHAITIRNIQKSFRKKRVLKGINGKIERGKVVGLLGRNGEGKTTLLRIMLDILAADSGEISILGMSPDGTGKVRQHVGYVPERPAFHEFMKVSDVFKLRAEFFPKWDWTKASEMTRKLELDVKTSIKGASKGTLAKTAWICATAHNPGVLLLDEPTSGLDAVAREAVISNLVRELSIEGKTILVTNHHMEELLGVLDEVWIIAGGRIAGRYSIQELRQNTFQVTGRMKQQTLPQDLLLFDQQRIGDLVRWVVMDKETLFKLRQQDLLEQIEIEPLPVENAFKILLQRTEEPPC